MAATRIIACNLAAWTAAAVLALCVLAAPPAAHAEELAAATVQTAQGAQEVAKASVSAASVTLPKKAYAFSGRAVKPVPKVVLAGKTLRYGRDFTVVYQNNKKVGKATLVVSGKGAYVGQRKATFRIGHDISRATAPKLKATTYTGKAVKAKPTLAFQGRKLKAGRDYALSYKGNVNAGTARVTVTGKGSYAGTKKLHFTIKRADIGKATVSPIAEQPFTGKAVEPVPTVRLKGKALAYGRDFTLSYSSNKSNGTARVTVKGAGNYRGKVKATFEIAAPNIAYRSYTTFNNNVVCVLYDDPKVLYLNPEPPKVTFENPVRWWDGKTYYRSVNSASGKVTKTKQIVLLREVYVADPTQYDAIVMPEGLAEAFWKDCGYTGEPNYISVWAALLHDAIIYKQLGVNRPIARLAPEWFIDKLYEIDLRSDSVGNLATYRGYVLEK